ncbi:VOC family protein [Streptomyces sp. UNOC14_S4]|uniref:VOC family protein n=1 Tax=Streptomyces sp. UNOC14_S4 TaxID=2872340 RepID=UPI001E4EDC71|nr:VOC family protein [Streptomyces sp. UNOC14_S4]MCC3771286.1 VOC family protein [Streptomyces sp. UNOC14_S4]
MSSISPGSVVWFEIGTAGTAAVQDFYGPLLGWAFETDHDSSTDGRVYTRIIAPGAPWPMGAIEQGGTGGEVINLSVLSADVHDDVERLTKLGATVLVPPTAVGDVTVFARLRDPLGNAFALFSRTTSQQLEERAASTEEHIEQAAYAPAPGSFAWFEIGTTDPQATREFYEAAFGWRFEKDDSAGGKPYFNVFTGNPFPSGGMYDHSTGPGGADYVMPSFLVTDVPATVTEATAAGAAVEHGPDGNPDGLVFARLKDPHGNRFGLFSMPAPPAQG